MVNEVTDDPFGVHVLKNKWLSFLGVFPDYKCPNKLVFGIDVLGVDIYKDPKLIFDYIIIKVIFTGENEFFYRTINFSPIKNKFFRSIRLFSGIARLKKGQLTKCAIKK